MPEGPTCHTGSNSCFQRDLGNETEFDSNNPSSGVLQELFDVIQERKKNPNSSSYTSALLEGDINRIAQKVVEEAGEVALAGATGRSKDMTEEMGDLLYHSFVLMAANEITLEEVWSVLQDRRSG